MFPLQFTASRMKISTMFVISKTEQVERKSSYCCSWRPQKVTIIPSKTSPKLCIGCAGHPRSDSKVPKASFSATVFNRICEKKNQKHLEFCEEHKPVEIQMPEDGKSIFFSNWQKTQWCLFVVYADLEAIDVKCDEIGTSTSNTTEIERQNPASFGAVIFNQRTNSIVEVAFYRGENCIEKLMETLRGWLTWAYVEKQKYRFLNISKLEREQLMTDAATACCICSNNFADPRKVIHHCHLTGHIFGVAHPECNLKARTVFFLMVFFHNLPRYDAHHIIKYLNLKANEALTNTRTGEVYISFSVSIPVGLYKQR